MNTSRKYNLIFPWVWGGYLGRDSFNKYKECFDKNVPTPLFD